MSAPHSGGAEPETGRPCAAAGSSRIWEAPPGQAGGEGLGMGQGRRALAAAAAPVTGSGAGWSGLTGEVGGTEPDRRMWQPMVRGRLLAGGDWRVRACRGRAGRGAAAPTCEGRGAARRCEGTGAAAGVISRSRRRHGSRQAVSLPPPDGWKGGAPLTNRLWIGGIRFSQSAKTLVGFCPTDPPLG